MADETIFAVATGTGRTAVAVIRISGPTSGDALRRLTGRLPSPRIATLASLRDPATGTLLDRALVLWFPAPNSFTGEPSAELHCHGGRAVVATVLEALGTLPGCRLAEPGEFTRRAFLNGKLDLAAVEGLADLIDAETEAQRRQALDQLDGSLGRWVETLRERLLDALAFAESAIDFSDEGDIASDVLDRAGAEIGRLAAAIDAELAKPSQGERIRDGFVVTLAGPPNAGKSTLLNVLARREVAIVSPHAGTTRDPIAIDLDLGGYAVRLIDTAGVREAADPVEQEGVARARARAASADLVLWLQDVGDPVLAPHNAANRNLWRIGTKADRPPARPPSDDLVVSAHTGAGIDVLLARLQEAVAGQFVGGETALVTRLRHRRALTEAANALAGAAANRTDPELMAEDLRRAANALGAITGRIGVEEILGAIFARFCIGK